MGVKWKKNNVDLRPMIEETLGLVSDECNTQ